MNRRKTKIEAEKAKEKERERSAAVQKREAIQRQSPGRRPVPPTGPWMSSLSFIQINLLNVSTGIARLVKLAGL